MNISGAMQAVSPGVEETCIKAVEGLTFASTLCAAHYIGQLAHESNFRPRSENLNYSAKRLTEVWPSRFATLAAAQPFARNPQALANQVYNGRMGNKDGSNDGWNFRGRGFIQITGRNNYTAAGKALNLPIVKNPDQVMTPTDSAETAFWFFDVNGIWALAEKNDIKGVTRRINGGLHGLADRRAKTNLAFQILSGKPPPLGTVRLNTKGADARLLQQALNDVGCGPIAVDGWFGRGSVAALKKFQTQAGLTADGVCGRGTWAALAKRGVKNV